MTYPDPRSLLYRSGLLRAGSRAQFVAYLLRLAGAAA